MTAFVVRNWEQTLQQMLGWIQANPNLSPDFSSVNAQNVGLLATDLTPGSLEVANLEALAMMLEDYDVRALQAINYATSESAYNAFGFPLAPAVQAVCLVTLGAYAAPSSPIIVPAGFVVSDSSGNQFTVTAPATLLAGAFSVIASVQAVNPGTAGNVAAGAIQRIVYPLAGIDTVTNAQQAWGGKDVESDASRATRFQTWVNSLVRGTAPALEYAALVVAPTCGYGFSVLAAYCVDPSTLAPLGQGVSSSAPFSGISYGGLTWLFVDDGSGGGGAWATTTLPAVTIAVNGGLNNSSNTVTPWKAGGVMVQILPVLYQTAYVSASILMTLAGHGRSAAIGTALNNAAMAYFGSLGIGQPAKYWGLLAALTAADPDVEAVSFLGMGLSAAPTGNADLTLDPFAQAGYRFVTSAAQLVWTLV